MANYKVKAGSHRAWPFPFGLSIGRKSMTRIVTFDDSARYAIDAADQQDWNKLFGFGYLWDGPHTNSARVVWRYNPTTNKIEIGGYVYDAGKLNYEQIGEVEIGETFVTSIIVQEGFYWFKIRDSFFLKPFAKTHNKTLSYPLGFYFGGTQVAPYDITAKINKA